MYLAKEISALTVTFVPTSLSAVDLTLFDRQKLDGPGTVAILRHAGQTRGYNLSND
jgi:hypothetical protein